MVNWPRPTTVKALRGLLGLTGYYRKHVANYGAICRPLIDLLKKDSFRWSPEAEATFEALKRAMSATPALALPDYTKEFVIETDACHLGIEVVLMQQAKVLELSHREKSMYEKEYMALHNAIDKWRHYLQFRHFVVRTNHHNLKYLLEQKITSAIQQKGLTKLLGLDYEVLEINTSYEGYPQATDMITQLAVARQGPHFWHYNSAYPRLLQPIHIPDQAWRHISMDFIEGLPKSHGKDVIFVVVDRLTKSAHFMALAYPFTSLEVANKFWKRVHTLHSSPETIVFDRDKQFLSNFLQALFKLKGIQLLYSSTYHPQTDGQTERMEKCIENHLRCITSNKPQDWKKWLCFHVSLLKKKIRSKTVVQTVLPISNDEGQFMVKQVAILQRQLVKRAMHLTLKY
uniref:Uncharacterized protein LOC104225416 n=1 Tax=Nicotiana sylvestris TaxID=4096 RepID=A0A1U7WA33_NICSY|nr:PREDICTED: uncharacterized protein LOC104225416 [Nicotiana sylvestris]